MVWVLTGIIIVIFILLYFFFYLLGVSKLFYSFVKEGEIEFSVTGETLHEILANVTGYYLKETKVEVEIEKEDKETGKEGKKEKISLKRFFPLPKGKTKKKFLGLYWIGFPPYRKILTYPFSWDRLISKTAKEEEEKKGHAVEYSGIGDIWISHRSEPVSSLFFRYTYPIVAKDIELEGRITIDIAFNVTVEVVVPAIPIFFLKGRWFLPLTAAFRGIISDCLKEFKLEDFVKVDKQKLFSDAVSEQNEKLFVSITGMEILQTNYIDYTVSGSEDERKAAIAQKIAQFNADAKIAEAVGTATARIKVAEGEATAIKLERGANAFTLKELLESAKEHPQGANVLIEQIKTEGLIGWTGNVLSLGQPAPLQIAVDEQNKSKEDKK